MNKMMTWEEFQERRRYEFTHGRAAYEMTDIKCPDCGMPLFRYTAIVLSTYPLKYRYDCLECKWTGTA